MDVATFWRLVERARGDSQGDADRQAEVLIDLLTSLPPEEIVDFDALFRTRMATAYRWDLWAAAHIINGGCSDDGFEYFRAWLIGQGERVFHDAFGDPESLVGRAHPDAEAEALIYAASVAYERTVGDELPIRGTPPSSPAGTRWDDDDLEQMYPKLWAAFT